MVTTTALMIAHYDMYHDKTTTYVSASLFMLWDGEQLGLITSQATPITMPWWRTARLTADPARAASGAGSTLYGEPELAGVSGRADDEDDPNPYDGDPRAVATCTGCRWSAPAVI